MTGYPVVEESGWRTRGRSGFRVVEGVVGHHTAGPTTGEYPCRNIILNGRSGLPGPLANFGLGRSGTIYVVAAGAANHAGDSAWAGYTDLNDEFLGIEAEDNGDGTWTSEQIDCYPRLVAALLHYMKRPASRYGGHKNVAIPAGRKPDPAGIDTAWMQSKVNHYLTYPNEIKKGYRVPTDAELDSWVQGGIRVKWLELGGMNGQAGKPLTKEAACADGTGRFQLFERGIALYHPATQSHFIMGGFRSAWEKEGREAGIGYPKSGELPHPEGAMQDFTNGVLTWNKDTQDIWLHRYILG